MKRVNLKLQTDSKEWILEASSEGLKTISIHFNPAETDSFKLVEICDRAVHLVTDQTNEES